MSVADRVAADLDAGRDPELTEADVARLGLEADGVLEGEEDAECRDAARALRATIDDYERARGAAARTDSKGETNMGATKTTTRLDASAAAVTVARARRDAKMANAWRSDMGPVPPSPPQFASILSASAGMKSAKVAERHAKIAEDRAQHEKALGKVAVANAEAKHALDVAIINEKLRRMRKGVAIPELAVANDPTDDAENAELAAAEENEVDLSDDVDGTDEDARVKDEAARHTAETEAGKRGKGHAQPAQFRRPLTRKGDKDTDPRLDAVRTERDAALANAWRPTAPPSIEAARQAPPAGAPRGTPPTRLDAPGDPMAAVRARRDATYAEAWRVPNMVDK